MIIVCDHIKESNGKCYRCLYADAEQRAINSGLEVIDKDIKIRELETTISDLTKCLEKTWEDYKSLANTGTKLFINLTDPKWNHKLCVMCSQEMKKVIEANQKGEENDQ